MSDDDKLEFREIIMRHLQRILELSSRELRDGSREIISKNFTDVVENEDTRIAFCQSVEVFAYVLKPYFDDRVLKAYKTYVPILNKLNFEIREMFGKRFKEISENATSKDNDLSNEFSIYIKMKYAKKLFVELNELLHRHDYLKTSLFGESHDEIISDDNVGGENE